MSYSVMTHSGEMKQEHTAYCVKCGTAGPIKEVSPEPDFDEKGWFYAATLKCRSSVCDHSWVEKIYVAR